MAAHWVVNCIATFLVHVSVGGFYTQWIHVEQRGAFQLKVGWKKLAKNSLERWKPCFCAPCVEKTQHFFLRKLYCRTRSAESIGSCLESRWQLLHPMDKSKVCTMHDDWWNEVIRYINYHKLKFCSEKNNPCSFCDISLRISGRIRRNVAQSQLWICRKKMWHSGTVSQGRIQKKFRRGFWERGAEGVEGVGNGEGVSPSPAD